MSRPARIAWCCASAAIVFLVWIAFGGSGSAGIAFFYVIPVGMATMWFGWQAGLTAALACTGLYALGASINPVPHFGLALAIRAAAFLGTVAVVSTLSTRIAQLEHSQEELEAIRTALAPPSLPELPGVDAAAAFVPSELGVSGDFYLLTNGPDGSTVAVVGDVAGHGPKAARLATFIRARLASVAANTSDPAEILELANAALLERRGDQDELVSAVCLRYRAESSSLTWAIAGHPLPLRLPDLEPLAGEGQTMLLGVREDLSLLNAEVVLDGDGGVLVYTDGATDLRRRRGSPLGLVGLQRLLAPLCELPARALAGEIESALIAWAGRSIRDDLCILVLRPRAD
jgi:serine phosphatase RsbU (regulator of sigma subunit)